MGAGRAVTGLTLHADQLWRLLHGDKAALIHAGGVAGKTGAVVFAVALLQGVYGCGVGGVLPGGVLLIMAASAGAAAGVASLLQSFVPSLLLLISLILVAPTLVVSHHLFYCCVIPISSSVYRLVARS